MEDSKEEVDAVVDGGKAEDEEAEVGKEEADATAVARSFRGDGGRGGRDAAPSKGNRRRRRRERASGEAVVLLLEAGVAAAAGAEPCD